MEVTTQHITDALFNHFNAEKGYKYQLCNSYVFRWESDFFCISSSGIVYEVEVKVSRADFLADFKKHSKHRVLAAKGDYVVHRAFMPFPPDPDRFPKAINPHWPPRSRIDIIELCRVRPNKFLYAVPEGLIEKKDIPNYAGLIYVIESHGGLVPKIVKRPPSLHKQKHDFTKILLEKYYWAYLRLIQQTRSGKNFQLPGEGIQ